MKLRTLKLALLSALVASHAFATEYRSPWVSGNGPLRYSFEKLNEESWNLNLWSAMHVKQAHKSFTKHSTKTQPLTAVMFGKSDFKIEEIYPDATAQKNAAGYNPLVAAKLMSPRAEYAETGMTVGLRFDYPVWEKHGRIGVRASVPFRRIEIERQDSGLDKTEDPTSDFVRSKVIKVAANAAGDDITGTQQVLAKAYRMDIVSKLVDANGDAALVGGAVGPNSMTLFGQSITNNSAGATAAGGVAVQAVGANNKNAAITVSRPGTNEPFAYQYQMTDANPARPAIAGERFGLASVTSIAADYSNLPVDGASIRYFDGAAAAGAGGLATYANLINSDAFKKNADKTWLIFRRSANSADNIDRFGINADAGAGTFVTRQIDLMLQQYNINAFQYLSSNGFSLDSEIRSGMGDIDLDVFYEHGFSDDLVTELALGVRLPTGGDKDKYTGAYKAILGNGEHWEIKLAGLVAYRPFSWMSVKADASYSFVLEGTERRCAVFKGSTVKNIGPRADADVSWSYMIGHVDFNFTHPDTKDIRSMLGYEFYYKTKDNVKFKKSKMESWLGKLATGAANEKDLSNTLAEKGTESITHKARFETSAQVLKNFEVFAGGAMAFAGQNAFRDRDAHCGFNVRF